MDLSDTVALPVTERSQPAEARRAATALATTRARFDETAAGRVAIVATEAATNLVKHAAGGEILVRAFEEDGEPGIELLALDKGRGMVSVAECQRDGYSTASSPGTGLGAIARLADVHDIYSQPGRGTAVLVRLWRAPRVKPAPRSRLSVGGVRVARRGEAACGDDWSVTVTPAGATLMVADGLGHGALAAEASREAVRALRERPDDGPAAVLASAHAALRSTRGAAVAVAAVDCPRGIITFAGIGNIAGVILSDTVRRNMVSHSGIVGHQVRRVHEFTYPWSDDAVLVLHSDGLVSHWSLDGYPGLHRRHPSLIAGVLYRDFARGRDDVTVVVAKRQAA